MMALRIAFATIGDARDIRRGSGTPYYLTRELQRQGHEISFLGPLNITPVLPTRLFNYFSKKSGRKYRSYRDPFTGRALGRAVESRLADLDYDILLTNDYSIAAYTRTENPIVLYTDDTFPYVYSQNKHPWLADLSRISVYFCHLTLRRGLARATQSIFASNFTAYEAEKYTRRKYKVIPYGANIDAPEIIPPRSMGLIRKKGHLDLLFIGKDWVLKGGETAIRITNKLKEVGIHAKLHVVGSELPAGTMYPDVIFYGLLNKDKPNEREKLHQLLSNCDTLVVPSKAEGYGLAFVEAAAYGLPSLAYASMGVLTAVQSGRSGILFDPKDDGDAFVHEIESWFQNPERYQRLSEGARDYYEKTANWKVAVSSLIREISEIVPIRTSLHN
jgi:glycosyltransferase involved in cell wall biosynthesis